MTRKLSLEQLEPRTLMAGLPLDANADGYITPADPLHLINEVNACEWRACPITPRDVLRSVADQNAHGARPVITVEILTKDMTPEVGDQVLVTARITTAEEVDLKFVGLQLFQFGIGIDWWPEHWTMNGRPASSFNRSNECGEFRWGSRIIGQTVLRVAESVDLVFVGTIVNNNGWTDYDVKVEVK